MKKYLNITPNEKAKEKLVYTTTSYYGDGDEKSENYTITNKEQMKKLRIDYSLNLLNIEDSEGLLEKLSLEICDEEGDFILELLGENLIDKIEDELNINEDTPHVEDYDEYTFGYNNFSYIDGNNVTHDATPKIINKEDLLYVILAQFNVHKNKDINPILRYYIWLKGVQDKVEEGELNQGFIFDQFELDWSINYYYVESLVEDTIFEISDSLSEIEQMQEYKKDNDLEELIDEIISLNVFSFKVTS